MAGRVYRPRWGPLPGALLESGARALAAAGRVTARRLFRVATKTQEDRHSELGLSADDLQAM
ncbi:MAG TPA: hypothetical protein VF058_11370, partial [Actinomycetota bacterium]